MVSHFTPYLQTIPHARSAAWRARERGGGESTFHATFYVAPWSSLGKECRQS